MKNALSRFVSLALIVAAAPLLYGQKDLPPPRQPTMGGLEQLIEDTVRDAGRRQDLIELGKDIDRRELALERTVEEFAAKLEALNADYNATRDQFDGIYVEFNDAVGVQRRRLAKKIMDMQAALGKDEWPVIGAALAEGAPAGFGLQPRHALERFGQKMRERIVQTVTDRPRRRQIEVPVETIETELNGYERTLNVTGSRVADIVRRQGAVWEDFDKEFTALMNDLTGALSRTIEARASIRNYISRDEWKTIFSMQEKVTNE